MVGRLLPLGRLPGRCYVSFKGCIYIHLNFSQSNKDHCMCHFLHPQYAPQRFERPSKGKSSDGAKDSQITAQEVVAASDFQHQSEVGKRGGDALGPNGEWLLAWNCGNVFFSNYHVISHVNTEHWRCWLPEDWSWANHITLYLIDLQWIYDKA